MNKIIAIVLAFATACVMSLALASPAAAATSGLCWVNGNTAARLSVSKWVITRDSVGNPKYRYHMDLNSSGSAYQARALYFRGVKQSSWNDIYRDTWGTSSTVTGEWLVFGAGTGEEGRTMKCSVVV